MKLILPQSNEMNRTQTQKALNRYLDVRLSFIPSLLVFWFAASQAWSCPVDLNEVLLHLSPPPTEGHLAERWRALWSAVEVTSTSSVASGPTRANLPIEEFVRNFIAELPIGTLTPDLREAIEAGALAMHRPNAFLAYCQEMVGRAVVREASRHPIAAALTSDPKYISHLMMSIAEESRARG